MEKTERQTFIRQVAIGSIGAVIITLIAVLIFAFILSVTNMGRGVVKPINQAIKLLSVFGGAMFAIRGDKGFFKGALLGLFYTLCSALIFGLIGGGITSVWGVLVDVACGVVMGMISGAISVNVFGKGVA